MEIRIVHASLSISRCLVVRFSFVSQYGYNSHEKDGLVRSVNIAELKNQLSKYLAFAKGGEEIVIRDRNLPVAKLVPFSAEEASEEELLLVASGKMRLPKNPLNVDRLLKIRTGKVSGDGAVQAVLDDRAESL
jgi:prevent-host-death family protein